MKTKIYIEGGGNSRELHIRCRSGFIRLLESSGFKGKMPKVVSCGSRNSTFDDFTTAHKANTGGYVAMLIDSEDPVDNPEKTWDHLRNREGWVKPDRSDDNQVLFMTTCMETWIICDHDAIKQYYGSKIQESALLPLHDLERRNRHEIQDNLKHVTRNCANPYRKNNAYDVLGILNPTILDRNLSAFRRMKQIFNENLY